MNELLILEIQRELEKLKLPTPLAISKEIVEFTQANRQEINKILKKIKTDEPWEYIKGYTHFHNNKIFVNRDVLIPRVETEEFVDIVIRELKNLRGNFQIFDIGTGSGCIAIALSKIFDVDIFAVDISKKALKVAKKNIKGNDCKKIKTINANLLNFNFDNKIPTVIVANLPYIPSEKIQNLDNSVKKYEPLIALDGGKNGADYYTTLIEQIKQKSLNLKYGFFEIDAANVKTLKKYNGEFLKDSFGKVRFFTIRPSHLK